MAANNQAGGRLLSAAKDAALKWLCTFCLGLVFQAWLGAASPEEIWKVYQNGEAAKAATMGLAAIAREPENIELRQVTGRALVDSQQFTDALPHLAKVVELDRRKSWQSAWALAYAGYAHFGANQPDRARTALEESLQLKATRNVVNFARRAQLLLGLAPVYSNWVTLETSHFRFHFSPENQNLDTNRFAASREAAFTNINRFFQARLPKPIDFFVWSSSADAEKAGLGPLGFARPELCLVQSAANQTRGHEMTHVLCNQALKPVRRTGLINEGLAVYFDQTGRNRLAMANAAVQEAGRQQVSLASLWTGANRVSYPVAGAFIERLRQKGGDEKLKQLAQDQTLEAARKIYGEQLDAWMAEFEQELLHSP